MKTKLISNNDMESVVVQCACIGHCSYVEFIRPYKDRLWMAIATSNRKRRYLCKLDKIEQLFNLTECQAIDFINILENIETIHSNTYSIKDKSNGNLYIRFEYIKLDTKPSKYDQVQITFYTSYKYFQKSMPDFDFVITRPMLVNLIKELRALYNQVSPD